MAKFNLAIDPKAIAQGIYDDETLLFKRYFTTASRSLPTVQLPEIICNNKSFLLNTVDMVTCTPRHFRVNAGSNEPDVRLPITNVDLDDINLDNTTMLSHQKHGVVGIHAQDIYLDLSNPRILNEVITIIHLRQIALHVWEDTTVYNFNLYGGFGFGLEYMIKALFYKDAVYNDNIIVKPYECEIMVGKEKTVPAIRMNQMQLYMEDSLLSSELANFVAIHAKVIRSLIAGEPLE